MSYQHSEYPEFNWSTSRVNTLNKCEREYFYTYYGSHNGWEDSSDKITQEIYKYKKLTYKNILAGNIIHNKAKDFINMITSQNNFLFTPSTLERHITVSIFKFRDNCIKSKKLNSSWTPKNNTFDMLCEYFYGYGISLYEGQEIKELITKCICNIALSYTFEDIFDNKLVVLENSRDDFPSFNINDTKIFALLDLLYINTEGKYVIVDWKTGRESENHRLQMLVYAKYVVEVYGINIKDIICRLEYLSCGTNKEYRFSNTDLFEVDKIIISTTNKFKDYLDDTTINKPKDISFFKTADDTTTCITCKYKGICN